MSYADPGQYRGPRGDPKEERPGQITSDSLAAESLDRGGDFAANLSNVSASSQPSRSTTANNYDTSAATTYPAADDSSSRLPNLNYQTPSNTVNPREAEGSAYYSQGVEGGATGGSAGYDTSRSGGGYSASSGDAPTYASADQGLTREQATPKGSNLTEGDFSSGLKNASFNNEIGTRNDPGRYAETNFETRNARAANDSGYDNASVGADGGRNQGGFENLGRDSSA